MKFKRFTFSLLSPLVGFHVGRNPVSGQRFIHVAPFPFFGIDFNLPPYDLNEEARSKLATEEAAAEEAAQGEGRIDAHVQDVVRQPPKRASDA